MIVDFCIPAPGESMLAAYQAWRHKAEKAAADYAFHMAVTQWSPQIHDEMETVVFNPSWGMPQSILVNEYLGKLRRDPGYFDRFSKQFAAA